MWVANRQLNVLNSINYRAALLHANSSKADADEVINKLEQFRERLHHPPLSEEEKKKIREEVEEEHHKKRFEKLDEGAFADVFLDKDTKRVVKKIKDSVPRESKEREVENHRYIQQRGNHKNVVKVLDSSPESILMEFGHLVVLDRKIPVDLLGFVNNTHNLEGLNNRQKILNLLIGYNMYTQLIDGLSYLHSIHVVHRDIKPENILVCGEWGRNMIFKFADFGLSAILIPNSDYRDYINAVGKMGSTQYCSPPLSPGVSSEHYSKVLFSSDYWSLMVTFYAATYATLLFKNMPLTWRNSQDPNYLKIRNGEPLDYTRHQREIDEIVQNKILENYYIEERDYYDTNEKRYYIKSMRLLGYFTKTLYHISRFFNYHNLNDYHSTERCVKRCSQIFTILQPYMSTITISEQLRTALEEGWRPSRRKSDNVIQNR